MNSLFENPEVLKLAREEAPQTINKYIKELEHELAKAKKENEELKADNLMLYEKTKELWKKIYTDN